MENRLLTEYFVFGRKRKKETEEVFTVSSCMIFITR